MNNTDEINEFSDAVAYDNIRAAAFDDYTDETEEEKVLHEKRRQRIAKMKKRKARQMFVRTHSKAIAVLSGILSLCIIIAVIVLVVVHQKGGEGIFAGNKDEIKTAENNASSNDQDLTDDTQTQDDEDPGSEETDTDNDNPYIDAEYGPYAEVYSDEKELFFSGYDLTKAETVGYPSEDDVKSTYAVLINAKTGEIVASKDGSVRIYPASMTKILTVLVAAEHVTDLDDKFKIDISITDYAYSHDCSAVGFSRDETVTVRDLMYGTILPSGGDAALALAEYVAGSHDKFVDMMNDKLKELGLSDTAHFTNCVGIYDDDHYCTLSDMAMIMKAAVENDLAKEILKTHIYTTSQTPEHPEGIEISNWFLRRIEDKDTGGEVVCAKTGFVKESGCCGASYEITDSGNYYICVTADAWSSWRCIYDHVAMYNAFAK